MTGKIDGSIGDISAPNGTVDVQIESATNVGEIFGLAVETDINISEFTAETIPAIPTSSAILVDGKTVTFDAYNINDNNYFHIRDLAYTLNGTGKQFDVNWYGTADTFVTLTSGRSYTVVGGEMEATAGDAVKEATEANLRIYLDGKQTTFSVYQIDGNFYFKLRDVAVGFDFGVDWDSSVNAVSIHTDRGYTA